MIKSASLGISILILCGASYWFGATHAAKNLPSAENPQLLSTNTQALITELEKLKAEQQSLQQQLVLLNTENNNNKNISTAKTTAAIEQPAEQHATIQT